MQSKNALRILAAICTCSFLLVGCGSSGGQQKKVAAEFAVPLYCDQTEIVGSFPPKVEGAATIFTDWEPFPGTDLEATYNAGGIACSYGLQSAEIGATILWAPNKDGVFNKRTKEWIQGGQVKIDLPNLEEESAYVLTEGEPGQGEYHVWKINLLIQGIWIQVGATFLSSIEEAMPIIKAAVDSLVPSKEAKKESIIGCYVATLKNDRFEMNLTRQDNSRVAGFITLAPAEKDSAHGTFQGTFENGKLHGIYIFESEGVTSERELYFKRVAGGFLPGYGPTEVVDNIREKLMRPLQLKWDDKVKYQPASDCSAS
jgi:hypothetical protein